ncbi:MAG TPA: response regulator, partial [Opitutaceae bacterium]|nr:response regulator [Opitutaceae bacterium]
MSGSTAKPVKVLIVEDREDDYRYLAMLLLRTTLADAYVLTWAPTFEEGLKEIAAQEFDVGLFDYQLGKGTGLDLLRETRKRGSEMPVILLTGFDSAEIDHEASQAGAADYLCKVELTTIQLERAIRYARRHASMLIELRRTTSLLDGILSSLPVLACRVDSEGTIIESRGHGQQIIGLKEGELNGTNMMQAFPSIAGDIQHAI